MVQEKENFLVRNVVNVFMTKDDAGAHIKKYCTDYKAHQCDSCDKAYKTKSALKDHKEIVHDGTTNEFPCEVC